MRRIKFFFTYYLYWLIFFILAKVIFLVYHFGLTSGLNFKDITGIFSHGFLLDMSAAGYLALFPLVILILTVYTRYKIPFVIIGTYTLLAIIAVVILTLVDLEIYKYWGTRLDNTALRFIGPPREMLASTSWIMIIFLSVALMVLS